MVVPPVLKGLRDLSGISRIDYITELTLSSRMLPNGNMSILFHQNFLDTIDEHRSNTMIIIATHFDVYPSFR